MWPSTIPGELEPNLGSRQGRGLVLCRSGTKFRAQALNIGSSVPTLTAIQSRGVAHGFPAEYYAGASSIVLAEYAEVDFANNASVFMSCWAQPTTDNPGAGFGGQYFIGKGFDASTEAYALRLGQSSGQSTVTALSYDGASHAAETGPINWGAARPRHICGGYDGTTWHAGYDGRITASNADATGPKANNNQLSIGAFNESGTPSRWFTGNIWDVRIYNYFPDVGTIWEMYINPMGLYLEESFSLSFKINIPAMDASETLRVTQSNLQWS